MTAGLTVAVDAMSGDHGAEVAVPAALDVLASIPDLRLIIVGRGEVVRPLLGAALGDERCRFVEATEVVAMDERPQDALRRKKNSSMRVAINLVEQGEASACVSAGNTGALHQISLLEIGRIKGIRRPALAAVFPTTPSPSLALDMGANADAKPEYLVQFAMMGSVYAQKVMGKTRPRVALLNIGKEEGKGSSCAVSYTHLTLPTSYLV